MKYLLFLIPIFLIPLSAYGFVSMDPDLQCEQTDNSGIYAVCKLLGIQIDNQEIIKQQNQKIISNQEIIKEQNSQLILQNKQMLENQNVELCLQVTDHPDTWIQIGNYLTERGIQCKGLTMS